MSRATGSDRAHLRLLVDLGAERIAASLRRPTPRLVLGAALPVVVLGSALWTLGRVGVPNATGAAGGMTLGLLVAGAISFLAYGVLFGGSDGLFLRQVGTSGSALYVERGLRLALVGGSAAGALVVPFLAAGERPEPALWIGLSSAFFAVGMATLAYAWAVRVTTTAGEDRPLSAGIRQWDPELARAAPLVYAPLLPFLGGATAGAVAGAVPAAWSIAGLSVAFGGVGILLGGRLFGSAAARFLPQAAEMAYAPPPEGEGEAFRVGRGLSALLPRAAAAVWVRDAAVASRRFGWAARVTWPVAVVSIIALARWGASSATHVWVLAAVGLALLIQSAAVVGLGLAERRGPRWIDRASGVATWERYLGRWAWSWGLSLWLLVPVGLAWWWWSGQPGAPLWPIAGAFTAAVSTSVSLLNSERR
ncbi:MAG: hypothetical protein WD766_00830 [Gemmatimonadota bacterium]